MAIGKTEHMTKSQCETMKEVPTTSTRLQRPLSSQCSVYRVVLVLTTLMATVLQSAFAFSASCARGPRFGVFISHQHQPVAARCSVITQARFTPLARDDSASTVLLDAKGQEVKIGTVVRVVVDHLKAYQVSLPGYGKYGPDKKFVPVPPGGPRGTKNLLLPVGIRGEVSKVYDVDDVSANHPIQVKFFPGKHVDEGYDPPVPFIMHFSPEEIECV